MKVLVIGGSRFLGRHLVRALLSRHHEVTLFNRGLTARGLFEGVEELVGDRDGGLGALAGRRWDAVIDTCGYVPRVVRAAVEALAAVVERYVFVSSVSVYADLMPEEIGEDAPLAVLPEPASEDIAANYGALKAACEHEVRSVYGKRALVVRPGLIVGPYDPTDRFTYWPRRLAAGGEVLAPGDPGAPVQFIDVRDLAEWIVRALTRGPGGTFNATGPAAPLSIGSLLTETARIVRPDDPARLTWCSEPFLLAEGVRPWTQLPLWVPTVEAGIHRVSIDRALNAGLSFRPLAVTVTETLAWARSDAYRTPAERYRDVGLDPVVETRLLAAWHARPAAM